MRHGGWPAWLSIEQGLWSMKQNGTFAGYVLGSDVKLDVRFAPLTNDAPEVGSGDIRALRLIKKRTDGCGIIWRRAAWPDQVEAIEDCWVIGTGEQGMNPYAVPSYFILAESPVSALLGGSIQQQIPAAECRGLDVFRDRAETSCHPEELDRFNQARNRSFAASVIVKDAEDFLVSPISI